jgi:hypothetical protein
VIGKVWNEAGPGLFTHLEVETPYDYNDNGSVSWGWHVAPYVMVEQADGSLMSMVIDPSLFSGPVSVDAWTAIQHDPTARTSLRKVDEPLYPGGSSYLPYDPTPREGADAHARATMDQYLVYQAQILKREHDKLNVSPATAGP